MPCQSSSDCPEPTSVCDTVQGFCVECLELEDCGHKPDTVCSEGACVCAGGLTYCEPGICVDTTVSPQHCGTCDHACFGSCVDGACADPWEPVSNVGAPSARARHVSVWTGTHLFVWGGTTVTGTGSNLRTGGLYDPATSTWTPTSTVGAPSARQRATVVWTGTHAIVWGGLDGADHPNTGAMYDPATNTWTPMSTVGAPPGRAFHTAVWTGSAMIVWGGEDDTGEQINSGGVFDPTGNVWTATAVVPVPSATRERHSAVWADGAGEMWIYGGFGDSVAPDIQTNVFWPTGTTAGGASYDPSGSGSWGSLATSGEPSLRDRHSAVYDGDAMLVFGGFDGSVENNQGLRYDGSMWIAFGGTPPQARREHTAVWLADAEVMVVWGGRNTTDGILATGAVYDSTTNTWAGETPLALEGRVDHTAVSTGTQMIVWGGYDPANTVLGTGAIFTP